MKVKSLEESTLNYIIGVVEGAIKTKWYWIKRGYPEEHAIENAVKYAIGQLSAGVGKTWDSKTCASIFREMSSISTNFAEILENLETKIVEK